jgi:hypothetical protein
MGGNEENVLKSVTLCRNLMRPGAKKSSLTVLPNATRPEFPRALLW